MFLRNALVRRLDEKFRVVVGTTATALSHASLVTPAYNAIMTGRELYDRVCMIDPGVDEGTVFQIVTSATTSSNLVTGVKCLIVAGSSLPASSSLTAVTAVAATTNPPRSSACRPSEEQGTATV
eukprot:jgi/Mesvir1/6398/Mv06730-RA.1